jgi:methylated-DNA-[protein]-cysteine S-methyltransferase
MTASAGHLPFDTALGRCAVAWSADGITRVWLPEARGAATPGTAPPHILDAVRAITALLEGEPVDLTGVVLDLDGVPDFHLAVYAIARTIPAGHTLTYGEIAARLGDPGAARAVGQAMGANPCPIVVPCHRVTAAGGALGGFSAPGGATTKQRLLRIEGALAPAPLTLFD